MINRQLDPLFNSVFGLIARWKSKSKPNITHPLRGESASHWWIPLTKGRYSESVQYNDVYGWVFLAHSWYSLVYIPNDCSCADEAYVAFPHYVHEYINGFVQDCRNSSALAMELPQSCTKPSICWLHDCWTINRVDGDLRRYGADMRSP